MVEMLPVREIVGEIDSQRIHETLAKLEKIRERFKDPIAPIQEPDKDLKLQDDLMVGIAESKQQKPARKRRWGRSFSSGETVLYGFEGIVTSG